MLSKFLITRQPPGGSVTDISDAIEVSENEGIATTTDSFSFSIKAIPKYDNFFDDGDNIKIYFASGSQAFQLVMDGFIKEILLDWKDKKKWTLTGQNRLEVLLNAPIPAAYSAGGTINTAPEIIRNLINLANAKWVKSKYSPNILAELKSVDGTNGKIDDTTKTCIPINYYRVDTPVYQMIEELSRVTMTTGDATVGNFVYYLDSNNRFVWGPRTTSVSSVVNVGDFLSAKIKKTLFDIINFVVIDAGIDFDGKPIKTYAYSVVGQLKGFQGKYFAKPELSNNLRKGVTAAAPWGTAVASGFADNAAFRVRVRADAKAWGQSIVNTFGAPRFKATIKMRGTTAYQKGNLYTIALPGMFKDTSDVWANSLNLRLKEVTHNFSTKGWFTQLEFEQDETTV